MDSSDHKSIEPYPWSSRASAMPALPGGTGKQIESLRQLASEIDRVDGKSSAQVTLAGGTPRTLQEVCRHLTASGLVVRESRQRFALTEEAKKWVASGDPVDLFSIFHKNIRYVGELLLDLVESPQTMKGLVSSARVNYSLSWTSLDQARRRVGWLICLGFVEYKTTTTVGLTQIGESVARIVIPGAPESIAAGFDDSETLELPEFPQEIRGELQSLNPSELANRNVTIGYIPRGGTGKGMELGESLQTLTNACEPSISRSELLRFTKDTFEVSESSFSAVLTTLTKSGLISQSGYNIYSPTDLGRSWLENPTALNLAMLLHTRYRAMLEIIPLLQEYDRAPALARAIASHFGLDRVDVAGTRTRIQLLREAGLIFERANSRFQSTPLGLRSYQDLPHEEPIDFITDPDDSPIRETRAATPESGSNELVEELRRASLDSGNSERLEKAVARAFHILGFEARHIGGGGRTDVLATVTSPKGHDIRVIIDAKSSQSGTVNEGAISFDTLREHKALHEADLVAIIGPSFETGRTKARAIEHSVRLITVDELVSTILQHTKTPLSAFEYIGFVSADEKLIQDFINRRQAASRRNGLLGSIVAILASESRQGDHITGGALTQDQIYLMVRESIVPRPSAEEIGSALQFLAHPLVASVKSLSNSSRVPSYSLQDSPKTLRDKLRSIASTIDSIEVDEE